VTGSGAAAALIAQVAFWTIVGIGVFTRELRPRAAVLFVLAWTVGMVVLPRVASTGALFVTPYVAVLDIVLAFVVFKGDVRLS
jgi:hypothetical protein